MKKYIFLVLGAVIFTSCTSKKEEVVQENTAATTTSNRITLTAAQAKNIEIESAIVSQQNLPATLQLTARTEVTPQDKISVSHMMGGFVKSINVLPGAAVKKGQVLAVLEDPSYVQLQEDYLTTKALLVKANADYTRQKELNELQAASTKILEEARAEQNLLQIKKRSLEEKLKLISIHPASVSMNNIKRSLAIVAPASGTINEVFVNRGQYASSAQSIVDMIQAGTPLLNIKAFENNVHYIRVGQDLEAFTNQLHTEKIVAKVLSISQHVNEDGSVDVLAKITETNQLRLTANMYFNVQLTHASKTSSVVSEDAVIQFEGTDYIFEDIGNNTYQWKKVTLGSKANGYVEITTPLDVTKKYVGKGAYALLMAMKNSAEE